MKTFKSILPAIVAILGIFTVKAQAATAVPYVVNVEFLPQHASGIKIADYYINDESMVPLFRITNMTLPEGYELEGRMQSSRYDTPLVADENMVFYVNAETLNNMVVLEASPSPKPQEFSITYQLYAKGYGQMFRLNTGHGTDYYWETITVTPLQPSFTVEDAYYVVMNGTSYAMSPKNPADLYDPPIFTATIDVPASGASITFRSKSGKTYGMSSTYAGQLVEGGSPISVSGGSKIITINLQSMEYSVMLSLNEIIAYTSSPSSGYALPTTDHINFEGFAGFRQAYLRFANSKTSPTLYWGLNYATSDNTGFLLPVPSNPITISLVSTGCYYIKVNLDELTYNLQPIEYFGVIGGFNSWSDDVVMTPTDRYKMVWTADVTFKGNDEFKIRSNGSWEWTDPNLGGSMDALVEHGPNITWPYGAGTFTLTLDLSSVPYKITAVKK